MHAGTIGSDFGKCDASAQTRGDAGVKTIGGWRFNDAVGSGCSKSEGVDWEMNQKRTLYHYPLCPFSRKVRLLLYEKGLSYNMIMETPWARRPEFLKINPAGGGGCAGVN